MDKLEEFVKKIRETAPSLGGTSPTRPYTAELSQKFHVLDSISRGSDKGLWMLESAPPLPDRLSSLVSALIQGRPLEEISENVDRIVELASELDEKIRQQHASDEQVDEAMEGMARGSQEPEKPFGQGLYATKGSQKAKIRRGEINEGGPILVDL